MSCEVWQLLRITESSCEADQLSTIISSHQFNFVTVNEYIKHIVCSVSVCTRHSLYYVKHSYTIHFEQDTIREIRSSFRKIYYFEKIVV